jgi:hypothetical protein
VHGTTRCSVAHTGRNDSSNPKVRSIQPGGWFAWSLSKSWFPVLFPDDALTKPSPFGIATRQWLYDKRNDDESPASGQPKLDR